MTMRRIRGCIEANWWVLGAGAAALSVAGCGGGEPVETHPEDPQKVTWHQDVAPIVEKHCGSCHVTGGIAPFALEDYGSAKQVAGLMVQEVEAGRMPPWGERETEECQPLHGFKGDRRLTPEEIGLIRQWNEDGALEGDPDTAAALPEPLKLTIDNPSLDLSFPDAYTVEGTTDDFECVVLDPGNTKKMWITEIQLTPGNPTVDHHGLVFLDFNGGSEALATNGRFPCFGNPDVPGYLLTTWVPGAVPGVVPPGAGMPILPGSRIVVQMHYHPTGKGAEKDLSSVQLKWTDVEPQYEAAQALIGNFSKLKDDGSGLQPGPDDSGGVPEFLIPAGVKGHVETMVYRQSIPLSIPIYSVGTHMHYVGTDMQVQLRHKSGDIESECMVQTPEWNFNWQRNYDYDAAIDDLPRVGPSDEIVMRCTYDNTLDNPFAARALKEQGLTQPKDVHLGEQTLDEMCIGLFGILAPPGAIEELFK
jgi:hypothetical protein